MFTWNDIRLNKTNPHFQVKRNFCKVGGLAFFKQAKFVSTPLQKVENNLFYDNFNRDNFLKGSLSTAQFVSVI